MPYGHLIAATVMTFGVCQGYLSIAFFTILKSTLRSPSASAELLVIYWCMPASVVLCLVFQNLIPSLRVSF